MKRLFAVLILVLAFIPGAAYAAEQSGPADTEAPDEIEQELIRQAQDVDISAWDEYFSAIGDIGQGASSMEELLISYAEGSINGSPEGLLETIRSILISELRGSFGIIAALAASAILTGISGVITDGGIKPVLSTALCIGAITLTAGIFVSLFRTAHQAIAGESRLLQSTLPIMSGLLTAIGSAAAEGAFHPLMTFLSGTVVLIIERLVLPVVIAGGVLSIADALNAGNRLEPLIRLSHSTAKWILGLLSALYFSITAINGMTMAMRDGVTVRTAKYALSRLVPVVGTMVSGTVDSVMGCALLIKNGAGILSVVILLSIMMRPLVVLAAGSFIFRIASALSAPVSDPGVTKLFSNAADMVSDMFACVAAAGSMFLVTIMVFIASGGMTAGLW